MDLSPNLALTLQVYENLEFDEDQSKHREAIRKRLSQMHYEVVHTMRGTFDVFKTDGAEVSIHI